MPKPDYSRIPVYFHRYVSQVKEFDLLKALDSQTKTFTRLLKKIKPETANYRYARGKWSIKEMLLHITDTERIFAYRALCIARGETAPLPGFDENIYADNSKASKRDWKDLVDEFIAVRASSRYLLASFDKKQFDAAGISSGQPVYVLGLCYVLVGHIEHHMQVLHERYKV